MKKILLVGGLLLLVGLLILIPALFFDPFGLFRVNVQFQPSRPPSADVLALIDQAKSGPTEQRILALHRLQEHGPDAEAAVPVLLDLLHSGDEDLRLNATLTLGKVGKAAAPPLCQLMQDRDREVRLHSVWALGLIGPDARDRSAEVVKLLSDWDGDVRRKAAETLGRIQADAEVAVPALLKALADRDDEVKRAADAALVKLGPAAVPALVKARDAGNTQAQGVAARIVGGVAPNEPAIGQALNSVLLGTPEDRSKGLADLAAMGPEAKPAVPTLVALLHSKDEDLRLNVALTLGKIGRKSAFALTESMRDPDPEVRYYAVWGLGMVGPDAREYTADAVRLLSDGSPDVRRKAADTLGRIQAKAEEALPALTKAFADENEDVRAAAGVAVTKLGPDAVPALLQTVKQNDPKTLPVALRALGEVGGGKDEVIGVLKEVLLRGDPALEVVPAEALAKQGKAALPALAEAMNSPQTGARQQAMLALVRLGPEAAPTLLDALKSKQAPVRAAAAEAFGSLMVSDKLVVLSLAEALADPEPQVSEAAVTALYALGPGAAAAVPGLTKAVTDHSDTQVRFLAARLLGVIGRPALSAVPALQQAAKNDKSPNVRDSAQWALSNLGPP